MKTSEHAADTINCPRHQMVPDGLQGAPSFSFDIFARGHAKLLLEAD